MDIYPHVSGVIMSQKAAKGLCITVPSAHPIFSPLVPRSSDGKTLASTPEASVVISKYVLYSI